MSFSYMLTCAYSIKELSLSLMLLNQGSHGFIKTHKWNSTIGAFINIEASGSGGAGICRTYLSFSF
jgi:hypothetical protein